MRFPMPTRRQQFRVMAGVAIIALVGVFARRPLWERYRLAQARSALRAHEDERALLHLEAARRLNPRFAETRLLLARAYRRTGRFDQVPDQLRRAFKFGAPQKRVQREEWLTYAQSGQFRKADPHLSGMLRDPGDDGAEICEAFVKGYFLTYRFDRALQLIDAWERDFPEDPQPHLYRGIYWEHFSNWNEAKKEFRLAWKMAPERNDIILHLAALLVRLHHYDEAEPLFLRYLKSDPDNPAVLSGWAKCQLLMGNTEEARRIFRRVLDIDADHFATRLAMGQLERAAARPQEALRWLKPVCEERPWDTEARYALATVLQSSGEQDAARRHFQFVSKAREGMLNAPLLTRKLLDQPRNTELRYRLGMVLLKYDNPTHGVVWLQSVLELQPNHRPAHAALAAYFAKDGQRALAEYHRRFADETGNPSGQSVKSDQRGNSTVD